MGAFDDLIPGSKQDFGAFGDLVPPEQGDFARGAKVALGQMAPIAKGVVGLAGATAEKAFGEGGLATGIKNWGLRGYTEGMQRLQPLQRETDDVTVAWERAKEGDLGALLDWAQYGIGYAVGQAGEAAGAALLGAGVGTVLAPEVAPVAGAAGAVTGLVAKGAVKQTAVGLIERAVAKEASRIMAESGGRIAAQEAVSTATRSITREIGASGALLTLGMGQELGSIYPEAEAEAARKGEQITGADLARVWASGLAAGGLEGLTDRLGIQAALGRIRVPGAQTRLGAAALTGIGGAAIEGLTEAAQTGIERFGAAQEITSPEGMRDIINSAALGAIGGAAIGGGIGAIQGPAESRARSNAAFQAIGAAKSADEAIAAFEQTYEEITVPPDFDAEGAMARLEAQRQRHEQGLRNPSMPDVPREVGAAPAAPSEPQLGPAEPFADRLLSLRSLIEDSRNRQQVRDTLGPVALNDLLYYLSAADNASLPGVTSDRMLQVAETILNRAQIRREERPGLGGKPAQAAIDATAAPAQIPLDTAPTGRIRVDTDGVAVQEIGADVISTADTMRAEKAQGFRFAGPGNLTEAVFPTAEQKLLPGRQERGADDLTTTDGQPYGTRSGAFARATREGGGNVVEVPGGWVVRPQASESSQDARNRLPADTKGRGNAADAPPTTAKGFDALNVEDKSVVQSRVLASIKDEKVLRSIVESVPVDVMNVLVGKELPAKGLLGNPTMLLDRLSSAFDDPVRATRVGALVHAVAASHPDAFAGLAAKVKAALGADKAPSIDAKAGVAGGASDVGSHSGDDTKASKRPTSDRWNSASLAQRQQWMRDIGRADLADKASIAKWDWLKLSAGMRAALMKTINQGAGDAQAVRGDAGQVREGRPSGQPGVQRGPEPSGGNLQREAQEGPGAAGPVRARPEAGQAPAQVDIRTEPAARWWRGELTQAGRRQALEAIGAPTAGNLARGDRAEVLWWYLKDDERSKLRALRESGWQPKEERNAATTEQPTERPAAPADRTRDEGLGKPPRPQEQEKSAVPTEQVAGGAAATPTTQTAATAGEQDGLQEEGQGRRQEVTPQSAGETPADPFARFDGVIIGRQIKIAETGKVATIRFDAGKALRDLAARENAIIKLRACMLRGGS